jgi:hypothetical protein
VFNPAKAFELNNTQLTTTVKSAQGRHPFSIRTDASQQNTIQISQFLAFSTPSGEGQDLQSDTTLKFGDSNSFIDIHYSAPSEEQLLDTMLSTYDELAKQPKGKLTPKQRYEYIQTNFQEAIADHHVNEKFIQAEIEGQMQADIAIQEWRAANAAMMTTAENPFNVSELSATTSGSSPEVMECYQLIGQKAKERNSDEIANFRECFAMIKQKGEEIKKS